MKTLPAEVVHDASAQLGEGPLWDYRSGELVWLDTPAGLVHWYRPADGTSREMKVSAPVSTICLRESGGYVLTHGLRLGVLEPGSGTVTDVTGHVGLSYILNDGSVDARGRLWAGTARRRALPGPAHDLADDVPDEGGLFRVGPDLVLDRVRDDVVTGNGIDWSVDGRTMYAVVNGRISVSDFAVDAGTFTVRGDVPVPDEHGEPDGLVVDAEDNLWVAFYGTAAVRAYRPDGTCIAEVPLPVEKVTSCTFGGPGLATLFITTGSWGLAEERAAMFPYAGALFAVQPGVQGRLTHRFAG